MVTEQFFEDYEIGFTRRSFGRTITEADIVVHAGQTGDFFPHHMDAEWCATQDFKKRIAHGTLVLSIGIGMTASTINPRSMSYGYDRVRFIRPVFIGRYAYRYRAHCGTSRSSQAQDARRGSGGGRDRQPARGGGPCVRAPLPRGASRIRGRAILTIILVRMTGG